MSSQALSHDVRSELTQRGVDDNLIRALERLDSAALVGSPAGGPVALAPSPGGSVAAFVRKHSIAIALDPEQAKRLHDRHGWRLQADNRTTSFIQVNSDDLERPGMAGLVSDVLVSAFDRAMHQTAPSSAELPAPRPARSSRTSAAPSAAPKRVRQSKPQHGAICQIHFVEKSVAGTCPMCDE